MSHMQKISKGCGPVPENGSDTILFKALGILRKRRRRNKKGKKRKS